MANSIFRTHHFHTVRKIKNTLYCTSATCYRKFPVHELEGKFIVCPVCRKHFPYFSEAYKPTEHEIKCNACRNYPVKTKTLEEIEYEVFQDFVVIAEEQLKQERIELDKDKEAFAAASQAYKNERSRFLLEVAKFKLKTVQESTPILAKDPTLTPEEIFDALVEGLLEKEKDG